MIDDPTKRLKNIGFGRSLQKNLVLAKQWLGKVHNQLEDVFCHTKVLCDIPNNFLNDVLVCSQMLMLGVRHDIPSTDSVRIIVVEDEDAFVVGNRIAEKLSSLA